jgi:hypothetical protein
MRNKARKGGKKNRKWGRNKVKCERYRREGRREKNKARKAARHEKRVLRKALRKAA